MTFIPLETKNFVLTKVQNENSIEYKSKDSTCYIEDKIINSKSIINTNNFSNLTNTECFLLEDTENLFQKKDLISDFYLKVNNPLIEENIQKKYEYQNHSYSQESSEENYFVIKDRLNNIGLSNENIKSYNFKNIDKIEKICQKYLPHSSEKTKLDFVINNLYKNYNQNYSLDYYKDLNTGFCNYNTINFFKLNKDLKTHSNCIVWPNLINNQENQYNFLQNSFTFSLNFNLRNGISNDKDFANCILHIPDFLNVYIVKADIGSEKYCIAMVTGKNTRHTLYDLSSLEMYDFDLSLGREYLNSNEGIYISSALSIKENYWYNLCFSFSKNRQNINDYFRSVYCYLDAEQIFSINKINFLQSNRDLKNSFIMIGNKPYYEKNIDLDYNKIFYSFFGPRFSDENLNGGPYFLKDVDFGKDYTWNDADFGQDLNVENIIEQNYYTFKREYDNLSNQNPESFCGEIHDIRIYSSLLSQEKVSHNSLNTIKSLSKETMLYNLIFYVPVFYIPGYTKKLATYNLSGNTGSDNFYYSCIYNPFFANSCGGLDITAENYLYEFVKGTKPNVVIGGNDYKNIFSDDKNEIRQLIENNFQEIFDKMKKGFLLEKIYKDLVFSQDLESNSIYKNLLVLPNDNGKLKVYFDVVKEFLEDLSARNKSFLSLEEINRLDLHNVDIKNIFKNSQDNILYFRKIKDELDSSLSYNRIFFNDIENLQPLESSYSICTEVNDLDASNNLFYEYYLTHDHAIDLSNFLYHDELISYFKHNNNFHYETVNTNELWKTNTSNVIDKYNFLSLSPVLRNYFSDREYFSQKKLSFTDISPVNNNIKEDYFTDYLGYSDINQTEACIFSTVFDISYKFFSTKIEKKSFNIYENDNLKLSFKDNGKGSIYRNNCISKKAEWNYAGHIFYKEGIVTFLRPELFYFSDDFDIKFNSVFNQYIHEINIPVKNGFYNKSFNTTYNSNLRHDESALNSESPFVYISDIDLHDENFNIIAKAKLARPAVKKIDDNILFRLKMDY